MFVRVLFLGRPLVVFRRTRKGRRAHGSVSRPLIFSCGRRVTCTALGFRNGTWTVDGESKRPNDARLQGWLAVLTADGDPLRPAGLDAPINAIVIDLLHEGIPGRTGNSVGAGQKKHRQQRSETQKKKHDRVWAGSLDGVRLWPTSNHRPFAATETKSRRDIIAATPNTHLTCSIHEIPNKSPLIHCKFHLLLNP